MREGSGAHDAEPAPPFELLDLDGKTVRLADFAGRTVVIDFWATWCIPCKQQIPVLNAFAKSAEAQDVVVLGIAVDADGKDVVAPFAAEHHIAYRVLLGEESLAFDYGAPGFPALAIVTPSGHIDSLHLGVIDRAALDTAVREARSKTNTEPVRSSPEHEAPTNDQR
jgi:thiol-disulfide isomerase/thioredoxin